MSHGDLSHELFRPERHFDLVSQWFADWNYPMLQREFLPSIGVVVTHLNAPVCCIWLYRTDSKLSILDGLVSQPNLPENIKSEAIKYLIETACQIARQEGYQVVTYNVKYQKTLNRFLDMGFVTGDTELTNVARRV